MCIAQDVIDPTSGQLPHPLIALDEAFLSATLSGEAAFRHASVVARCGVVLQVDLTASNKGADLTDLSQYAPSRISRMHTLTPIDVILTGIGLPQCMHAGTPTSARSSSRR